MAEDVAVLAAVVVVQAVWGVSHHANLQQIVVVEEDVMVLALVIVKIVVKGSAILLANLWGNMKGNIL